MIGELGELVDWVKASAAGWRYIFSARYRQQVHSRWRNEKWFYIAGDVLCGIAGIAFSLGVCWGIGWLATQMIRK
jgi:hypothetical protein